MSRHDLCIQAPRPAGSTIRARRVELINEGDGRYETHLPPDLEQFVEAKVRSGRFASPEEAIAAGVRLLRQQEEAEEAGVLEGIHQGLDDMRAVADGRPKRCSLTSGVSSIYPRTHDLPHRHRADGRAGDRVHGSMEDRASSPPSPRWYNALIQKVNTLRRHPLDAHWPLRTTNSPRKSESCSAGQGGTRTWHDLY